MRDSDPCPLELFDDNAHQRSPRPSFLSPDTINKEWFATDAVSTVVRRLRSELLLDDLVSPLAGGAFGRFDLLPSLRVQYVDEAAHSMRLPPGRLHDLG